jgi:uncharacterized membrane protein
MSEPDAGTFPQPAKRNPIAIASLICGLIACIPFVSILAIGFGIIGWRKTKAPGVRGKGMAIAGIVLGSIGVLANIPVIYFYAMLYHTSQRIRSASHMREIGESILAYENENLGRNPPDLGTLVKKQNVPVEDFLCPSMPGGSSLPPTLDEMTTDQKADWVNQNSDVVYLGAGLGSWSSPDLIVLYEKQDERNSPPDGSYDDYEVQMLFAGGNVVGVPSAEAHRQIDGQAGNRTRQK